MGFLWHNRCDVTLFLVLFVCREAWTTGSFDSFEGIFGNVDLLFLCNEWKKNQLLNRCKRLIWKSRCHYYYYKASALNNFSQFYPELVRNEVEIISRNHKFAIHIAFVIWWIIGKIMRNVSSHFTFNFIFTYSHGNNGGFCYNLKTDTFLFSFFVQTKSASNTKNK